MIFANKYKNVCESKQAVLIKDIYVYVYMYEYIIFKYFT